MADRISYGPITLYESDAYKRGKQLEATKKELEVEKAQLDLQRARQQVSKEEGETLSGRVGQADIAADVLEQARQKRMGVEIGAEIGREATAPGGLNLLEATAKQAGIDREIAREGARLGAIEQYMVDKGLTPTAKIDVGGITQTVPAVAAPTAMADIQAQAYNAGWPKISSVLQDQGYAKDDADRQAKQMAASQLIKNANNGKIDFAVRGSVMSVPIEKAIQMYKDPSTPKNIREQLELVFGKPEVPAASSWINTRLGR